mmetsp:Transcript_5180/g.13290  ORF Transcript_5180/g.13290 Transcript_5180/m.13290 type:complete len:229 (+) Transcript_5180:618-1304(+)
MKPMPASARHCSICSGPRSITTPRFSSTSALPQRLETERLPCLATVRPHADVRTQAPVEMLTVPALSPPVPTMSTAVVSTLQGVILSCMALASPATSWAVSPLARRSTRKAAIFAGSPSSTSADSERLDSSKERSVDSHSVSRTLFIWNGSPAAARAATPAKPLLLALPHAAGRDARENAADGQLKAPCCAFRIETEGPRMFPKSMFPHLPLSTKLSNNSQAAKRARM